MFSLPAPSTCYSSILGICKASVKGQLYDQTSEVLTYSDILGVCRVSVKGRIGGFQKAAFF
jgi:hypothetical protein